MTNQFCHFLSNGYTLNVVNNQLTNRPCCVYPKFVPLSDVNLIKQQLDYTSSATSWIPECKECQRIEQIGSISMRELSKRRVVGEFEPGDCVSLEVNFDKKCNAACLSCSPQFSSTWEKYNRKFSLGNQITVKEPNELFQEFINTVALDKLQFLYIQGGEPFYSTTNLNFLEHILKVHPTPANITVHYQTNGSLLPTQQVIEYWKNFKSVVMNYSIDDISNRFNYLRWPLDWNTVEQNVKTMIETTNISFQVNSTINPLNILDYSNLESWILDTIPTDRLISYRAGACLGDLDLRHTPKNLREAVLKKYGSNHKVSILFNTAEIFNYHVMLNYVELHDNNRRLDWRLTFPESVPFFI
jgi:MoaA/NifB/PqqE/SkfB family radical SAM enzyme